MDFKSISIDDKNILSPILKSNKYGICEFPFASMYMWRNVYRIKYTIHKGYLIFMEYNSMGQRQFLFPLKASHISASTTLKEVINDIIAYCCREKEDFRLSSLSEEMIEELKPILPQEFEFNEPTHWDYLYKSKDLIGLVGKKFQQKRNQINKFNSLYNYNYIDLTQEHIPYCLEILEQWKNLQEPSDSIDEETLAVADALTHMRELELLGGGLLIDGKLRAFALGQAINENVFGVMIEKGDYEYSGIFAKMNQTFAERNCNNYEIINREEDLGIEGLRKSKISYNPTRLLTKATGILKYTS